MLMSNSALRETIYLWFGSCIGLAIRDIRAPHCLRPLLRKYEISLRSYWLSPALLRVCGG
jgi:hypothetical protein